MVENAPGSSFLQRLRTKLFRSSTRSIALIKKKQDSVVLAQSRIGNFQSFISLLQQFEEAPLDHGIGSRQRIEALSNLLQQIRAEVALCAKTTPASPMRDDRRASEATASLPRPPGSQLPSLSPLSPMPPLSPLSPAQLPSAPNEPRGASEPPLLSSLTAEALAAMSPSKRQNSPYVFLQIPPRAPPVSKTALKLASSYCNEGKEVNNAQGKTRNVRWKSTAEVKEIDHHKNLPTIIHESLWYTNEEWVEMEQRNAKEQYEEQLSCEYGYARFVNGYYEYIGEDSSDGEDTEKQTSKDANAPPDSSEESRETPLEMDGGSS